MRDIIKNFINGLAFGITETVPGVSGSTIAIILGFYGELIEAINHFTKDIKKYLRFAVPFLLGTAAGLLLFSSLINYLLEYYSLPAMTFFIGLIIGVIPLIYKKVRRPGEKILVKDAALVLCPIILLVIISNVKGAVGSAADPAEAVKIVGAPYMIFIFIAGVLAAAALIIPGVSGSFVLLLFGVYPLVMYSVSSVGVYLTNVGDLKFLADIMKVLVPLAAGIIVGGLAMARVIERLLANHYRTTYSLILGLLTGSVYTLFKDPIVYRSGVTAQMIALGAATLVCGAAASFFIGKKRL